MRDSFLAKLRYAIPYAPIYVNAKVTIRKINRAFQQSKTLLRSCLKTPAGLLREAVKRLGYTVFFEGETPSIPATWGKTEIETIVFRRLLKVR